MTEERKICEKIFPGRDAFDGWVPVAKAPPKNWEELEAEYVTKIAELRYQIGGMQMQLNAQKDFKPRCAGIHIPGYARNEFPECRDCPARIKKECVYKRD